MSLNKESSRRDWMFGVLGACVTAAFTGCDNTAEDPTKFPPVDASQAVKDSDAPLASNKDVDPATAGAKAANNRSDARPAKPVFLP